MLGGFCQAVSLDKGKDMIYLFIIFCLLQCADIYTTWKALSTNVGHEANPIMAWLFSEVGLKAGLVIAKIMICAVIYYFVTQDWLLAILDIAYAEIIWNNFKVLKNG
jgi:hypothetical protein